MRPDGPSSGGPVNPSSLASHTINPERKAELIWQFFTLFGRCIRNISNEYNAFGWAVMEKLGQAIPHSQKRLLDKKIQIEGTFAGDNLGTPAMKYWQTLSNLGKISEYNQEKVAKELSGVTLDQFGEILISNGIDDVIFNNIINHLYNQKFIPALLRSLGFDEVAGTRNPLLATRLAAALIKLGRYEMALPLLEQLAFLDPQEIASWEARNSKGLNIKYLENAVIAIYQALAASIPEISDERGLAEVINRYAQAGSPMFNDSVIVTAGYLFPPSTIDRFLIQHSGTTESSSLIRHLLELGKTIRAMHTAPAESLKIFTQYWNAIETPSGRVRMSVTSELERLVRHSSLLPGKLLRALSKDMRLKLDSDNPTIWQDQPKSEIPPTRKVIISDPVDIPAKTSLTLSDLDLRDRVRQADKLLFVRNISLSELLDMHSSGSMRVNGAKKKYFRYGLEPGYGKEAEVVTVVMKRSFWEAEKQQSVLKNPYLNKLFGNLSPGMLRRINAGCDPGKRIIVDSIIDQEAEKEELLNNLVKSVDFNRNLELKAGLPDQDRPGMTVAGGSEEKYMGMFPQLEVTHDVSFDQIEQILVPEHLWEAAEVKAARIHPVLAKLLFKVEGTGKTEAAFLASRDLIARRSHTRAGQYQPNMGYTALFEMEKRYFQLVLGIELLSQEEYLSKTIILAGQDYEALPHGGWIWIKPKGVIPVKREENDWKIFVNPREENFLTVFQIVMDIIRQNREAGIHLKTPLDLSSEWRAGRKIGSVSDTPKIVIYVNKETAADVMCLLEEAFLSARLTAAGFGERPGPSFANKYGTTDLLFYKKEYGYEESRDQRALIADAVEADCRAKGITDENEIMRLKIEALNQAGFVGKNFYLKSGDRDPVITLAGKPNPENS